MKQLKQHPTYSAHRWAEKFQELHEFGRRHHLNSLRHIHHRRSRGVKGEGGEPTPPHRGRHLIIKDRKITFEVYRSTLYAYNYWTWIRKCDYVMFDNNIKTEEDDSAATFPSKVQLC